ncbi:unnamed protein product [[Candida] boidinii]|nr:unnamed protein product [[Candida] boidinii]
MKAILSRVDKWMKVSNKFSKDGANSSMVTLLDELGKEKAIEVIKVTKTKKAAAAVAAAAAAAASSSSSSTTSGGLLTEISNNSNTISANSKNAGDNGNLHPGAKAHFNKFIHHNFDSVNQMKRTHSTANPSSATTTTTTNNNDTSSNTTTPTKNNKQQKKDNKHTPNSSNSTSGVTSTMVSASASSPSETATPVKSVNNTSTNRLI